MNITSTGRNRHNFSFGGKAGGEFLLDGKPFQIRSGEMHPQRIPKACWSHRVAMARAMGLNTIAFYTMWNDFEQSDGSFDFETKRRDIAGFLQVCQDAGMWVLFRPGPYVCGEWDFGGIPSRLLKHPDLKIRTLTDQHFMAAQTEYLKAVAAVAAPFRISEGGPILMTQLENEYGSYQRKEYEYMQWLKDFWIKQGFGPFYTSDGATEHHLKGVVIQGVAVGLDPGETDEHWTIAQKMNPGVPVFSSETYPGWLRHWGEGNWVPTDKSDVMKWYMENGKSFNLFMTHGGTNFGFSAGANHRGPGEYEPDLTSYDYASPINEQGCATEKYHQLREIIASYVSANDPLPEPPAAMPSMEIPDTVPERIAGLWDLFPSARAVSEESMWFESWEQNQGMAIYRALLPAGPEAILTFENLNDYGQFYLDGKRLATIDRRRGVDKKVNIPAREKPVALEILVEAMGHINFNVAMESDRKGLFGVIRLDDKILDQWEVAPLPLNTDEIVEAITKSEASRRPGSHFRTTFNVDANPADTFIDMSHYEKGMVWVNGNNLGRYWSIGPQLRLYCPASWIKKGENIVDIIDLEVVEPRPIRGFKERNNDMKSDVTRNANNEW